MSNLIKWKCSYFHKQLLERIFSSMNYVKNKLRNKMGVWILEWLLGHIYWDELLFANYKEFSMQSFQKHVYISIRIFFCNFLDFSRYFFHFSRAKRIFKFLNMFHELKIFYLNVSYPNLSLDFFWIFKVLLGTFFCVLKTLLSIYYYFTKKHETGFKNHSKLG